MSTRPPASFITEASVIAKESINPVSIKPALIAGVIVFTILMYMVSFIVDAVKSSENNYKYNAQGCQLDDAGNVITAPIQKNGKVVGQSNCVTRTPSFVVYGFGFLFSAVLAFAAGSGVYKIGFYLANPKLGTGLYATDMLLGR